MTNDSWVTSTTRELSSPLSSSPPTSEQDVVSSAVATSAMKTLMVTPFAGANRSRFKGLRLFRTLSAYGRSPVVWSTIR